MVATGEAISRVAEELEKKAKKGEDSRQPTVDANPNTQTTQTPNNPNTQTPKHLFLVPVLTLALVVPIMVYQATTPEVTVAELPDVHLRELPGFTSEKLEPSEAELQVLPKDTRFEKRRYTASNGEWMIVSLVYGGKSKSSIHRPELCLPAQGFQMEHPRTRDVAGRDWRMIDLTAGDSPPFGFAYTFFNQEGFRTASHVSRIFRDVVDRSLFNRIDRWVMVTVNASRSDDAGLARLLSLLDLEEKEKGR